MKSPVRYFENFSACCDVIIPNFREMDQIREQRKYLRDRHQNWYLEHFEGAKPKNENHFLKMLKILPPAVTSLSPILGKWTKLGNNGTTCWTDTKIGI